MQKIRLLKFKKMKTIIIVGAMANNFIKYKGYNIGKSLFEKDQENLFFPLDNVRQKRYYFAINKKQLEVDGDINSKIDEYLNQSEEEEIDTSYGIYPTNYEENFVYCKAYTNSIQEYK